MKVQSIYMFTETFSAQLAELFRTSAIFILPPPVFNIFYNFIAFDFILPLCQIGAGLFFY